MWPEKRKEKPLAYVDRYASLALEQERRWKLSPHGGASHLLSRLKAESEQGTGARPTSISGQVCDTQSVHFLEQDAISHFLNISHSLYRVPALCDWWHLTG